MRKLYILFLLVAAMACHKKDSYKQDLIVGKWELRKSAGSIAGTIVYPAGNGRIIQYKSDNTYTAFINTTTVSGSGTYTLQPTSKPEEYTLQLINSSSTYTTTIRLNATELVRLPEAPCCDMPTDYYARL